MNRFLIWTVTAMFLASVFGASFATAGEPRERQERQRARIHSGVHKGTLVPAEARKLRSEQRRIQKTKKRMLADDGKLGPAEKVRLARMQDRASRHISRAKRNARVR